MVVFNQRTTPVSMLFQSLVEVSSNLSQSRGKVIGGQRSKDIKERRLRLGSARAPNLVHPSVTRDAGHHFPLGSCKRWVGLVRKRRSLQTMKKRWNAANNEETLEKTECSKVTFVDPTLGALWGALVISC